MTNKPTLPSVAEFFAQYAGAGVTFNPFLNVRLSEGGEDIVLCVIPNKGRNKMFPIVGVKYSYRINGKLELAQDITAVLDDAGNVIAGEV